MERIYALILSVPGLLAGAAAAASLAPAADVSALHGPCWITLGDRELACAALTYQAGADGKVTLLAQGPHTAYRLNGQASPHPRAADYRVEIASLASMGGAPVPAQGVCTIGPLDAAGQPSQIDCDTFSAYGGVQLRFYALPKDHNDSDPKP